MIDSMTDCLDEMPEELQTIVKGLDQVFGGVDCLYDEGTANIYFRAHKPDADGRAPAVAWIQLSSRGGWHLQTVSLSIPVRVELERLMKGTK